MGASQIVAQMLQQKNQSRKDGLAKLDDVAKRSRINYLGREFLSKYSYTPEGLESFAKDYRLNHEDLKGFAQTMADFEKFKTQQSATKVNNQAFDQRNELFPEELGTAKASRGIAEGNQTINADKVARLPKTNQQEDDKIASEIAYKNQQTKTSGSTGAYYDANAESIRRGDRNNLTEAERKAAAEKEMRETYGVVGAIDETIGTYGKVAVDPDSGMVSGIIPAGKVQEAKAEAARRGYILRVKETTERIPGMPGRNQIGHEVIGLYKAGGPQEETDVGGGVQDNTQPVIKEGFQGVPVNPDKTGGQASLDLAAIAKRASEKMNARRGEQPETESLTPYPTILGQQPDENKPRGFNAEDIKRTASDINALASKVGAGADNWKALGELAKSTGAWAWNEYLRLYRQLQVFTPEAQKEAFRQALGR